MESGFPPTALEPCSIYVHDLHAASGFDLPVAEVPANWEHGQYATELWLQRALRRHPWRAESPEKADVIFVAANFSLACVMSMYKQRALWNKLVADPFLYPAAGDASTPTDATKAVAAGGNHNRSSIAIGGGAPPSKFVTFQYAACRPPWQLGSRKPSDVVLLKEYVNGDWSRSVVSPFVVSRPPWLVGAGATTGASTAIVATSAAGPAQPVAVAWHARKLVFFAGHVPKPYIRPTRYLLWRQGRRDPRVTTVSSTLSCQVGAFAKCDLPTDFLKAQNNSFWLTHCHNVCGTTSKCMASRRISPKNNMAGFVRACLKMKQGRLMRLANFTAELPDMIRDTRRVPHGEYLRLAMSHRFCLIVPGDWVSTHKVTEAMALGGAGGCIPVFVAPGSKVKDIEQAVTGMLPYTRWHDYCATSYFISEYAAKLNFSAVLERLERVSEAEATSKLAALRRVRDAFVFRREATLERPSAPQFLLGEVCAAARGRRAAVEAKAAAGAAPIRPKLNLRSCVLGTSS